MANKQTPLNDERSEVEFLYFKGKLRSTDIQALVSGFASTRSSVLPNRTTTKRISPLAAEESVVEERHVEQEVDLDLVEDGQVGQEDETATTARASRSNGGKRTYPTPDTVDVDLESGEKPFSMFAAEKAPGTHREKYLVAAEWLRSYRNISEITAGHVRTCYVAVDWNFDVVDPTQPFRKLKKEGLGAIADGKFTIKHLGTSEVNKMKASGEPTA